MDQQYAVDSLEPHMKPQAPLNNMRRYYDDHDFLRQNAPLDLKYPFPQAHLYPTSLSRGPAMQTSYLPPAHNIQEVHMDDPRYVPLDLMSLVRDMDEKRMRGMYGYPAMMNGPGVPRDELKKKDDHGLVLPIPPLHVQQQNANADDKERKAQTENVILSKCLRCKKDFVQRLIVAETGEAEPKVYKLCHHCRDLQRQRLRRWQKKTKDKHGACRRCGTEIPPEEQKYVLCPQCRQNLRIRKANRAAQGKCVHCLGPINVSIIGDEKDESGRRGSQLGSYKVCQRCRENDKIRRTNLERMGNCNRCAKALSPAEQGKHKVCSSCRQKKKKLGAPMHMGSMHPDVGQNVLAPPPNYVPAEQAMLIGHVPNVGMGQEYPVAYGAYGQPLSMVSQMQQLPQPVNPEQAQYQMQQQRNYRG